jgi:hypothetical protein
LKTFGVTPGVTTLTEPSLPCTTPHLRNKAQLSRAFAFAHERRDRSPTKWSESRRPRLDPHTPADPNAGTVVAARERFQSP